MAITLLTLYIYNLFHNLILCVGVLIETEIDYTVIHFFMLWKLINHWNLYIKIPMYGQPLYTFVSGIVE